MYVQSLVLAFKVVIFVLSVIYLILCSVETYDNIRVLSSAYVRFPLFIRLHNNSRRLDQGCQNTNKNIITHISCFFKK